jgi:uncharacterized protein
MRSNAVTDSAAGPNSWGEIEKRVALGRISWTGPITLVMARTFLLLAAQAVLAGVYALRHHPSPWRAAAPWWSIYGTLVDLGCLSLMAWFKRSEGIRFRDLIGTVRMRRGRDVFTGLRYYLLIFPCFVGGSMLSSLFVYGSIGPHIAPGQLHERALPVWAVIYTLSVWWIVWSPTEETTYQAYVLPRLEALAGRAWVPVAVVSFWWALQHCALPLIPDWRYIVWRFGAFLPGVLVSILIYRRTRRLAPMIVAHWPMDIAAAIFTVKF